jgi:RNA polymerase sigma factor (sigma-70 family)
VGAAAPTFSLSLARRLLTIRAVHDALPYPDDFHLALECLEGKTSALTHLQETYREPLLAFLQGSGALPHEAAEIVTELWSDCVASQAGTTPKLARYNGTCSLKTFLNTITLNVLVTHRRRDQRWKVIVPGEVAEATTEADGSDSGGLADSSEPVEAPLLNLMREAIQAAFTACPAEDFVLLQLAHTDDLRVVELAKMFGCSIASISRHVALAGQGIAEATIQYVKATDPWLELKWEDFIELCGSASPACFGVE